MHAETGGWEPFLVLSKQPRAVRAPRVAAVHLQIQERVSREIGEQREKDEKKAGRGEKEENGKVSRAKGGIMIRSREGQWRSERKGVAKNLTEERHSPRILCSPPASSHPRPLGLS